MSDDINDNKPNNKPIHKRTGLPINFMPQLKRQKFIYLDEDISLLDDFNLPIDEEIKEEKIKEFVNVEFKVKSIEDIIELGKTYDDTKEYNIDMKMLKNLVEPLTELKNLIGMRKVKKELLEHITYHIQKLDDKNMDMLHTIIEGPPGVGKTELGKILGKVYMAMGILKNKIFKKVSRSDLVAKYLGQTAIKTQDLIDSCRGGVMFIDEVYSLGSRLLMDSFSKEAIDTLNQNLSERKTEFICIVAGYSREIEECFLSYNQGLKSRFPVKFTIDPYTPKELLSIFEKITIQNGWFLDASIDINFFKKNYKEFRYYGRDMELLFTKAKRGHSKRLMLEPETEKKMLNISDLNTGFNSFLLNR